MTGGRSPSQASGVFIKTGVIGMLLVAMLLGTHAPVQANAPIDFIEYVINGSELREDFEADGLVELQVPDGNITIQGIKRPLFSDSAFIYHLDSLTGAAIPINPVQDYGIRGHLLDDESASVVLYLGQLGAYGAVYTTDSHYTFNARLEDGVAIQNVTQTTSDDGWGIVVDPECTDPVDSRIAMFLDRDFLNNVDSPTDRVRSAFNMHVDMWCEYNLSLYIHALVYSYNDDIITTTDPEEALDEFRAEMALGSYTFEDEVDHQQLWTGKDLAINWIQDAGGVAYSNTAIWNRIAGTWEWQASIVEGVDFWWDAYDPDEVDDRGLVSGHEMSHSYGEENHPTDCTSSSCNIMYLEDPDDGGFWWTSGSKNEIRTWIGTAQEPPEGS